MRGVIFALAALVLFWAQASTGQAAAAARDWTWGVAIGSPQVLAVTLETRADATLRVQCHAGTLLVLSSVGIRAVMLSPREGIAPYVYLGAGIVHTAEGEGGGPQGSTGYGWGGVGARLPQRGVTWFVELGVQGGMDTGRGYESWLPSVAIGIAFGGARRHA